MTPFFSRQPSIVLLSLATAIMFAGLYGCGGDSDAVVVDFSKTVSVKRPVDTPAKTPPLKVAVAAMISPKQTFVYYRQLLDYIGRQLDRDVELVQRKTYREVNELLGKGQIDLAFICSGPYVSGRDKFGFELLATPEVRGSHFYRSYLIVNRASKAKRLEDLRGRVFAFTDPESNTGKLVPTHWLNQIGQQPKAFFSRTMYTYSHDNAILAVSRALVDGAAVDSLIWEYYSHKNPAFTAKTRIIKKSQPYGIPPIVASDRLASELRKQIREAFFAMHRDRQGQKILAELMITRFVSPRDEWYDSIRQVRAALARVENQPHASFQP